ncbi:MAG: 4-(cytidine 5'-diphospho)-2-C-methyl-D-erythritol kinase [Lentisphaeraceae bacterium]|nr:4-(cytidine 5'-diphospho)-2-C-methyl-D-erythritol kinase [Lentisphaeraceae bacterium]
MIQVQASSPGKINLFLDVTNKLENGYHEILTLFLPIHDLADSISISKSDSLKIICEHPGVPCDEKNLCWIAAEKFAEASGDSSNWQITIDKKLPVAGGMGGGSSNAATVLSLLNSQSESPLSSEVLSKIALSIGADVPYFLNPVPSLAEGIGEKLIELKPNHKIPLLLIGFDFPIPAVWAYKNRLLPFHQSKKSFNEVMTSWNEEKINLEACVYNDLAFAARKKFPILQLACDDLKELGGYAEVSGSGPTVFAAFDSEEARDKAYEGLIGKSYPAENIYKATAG